jgi:hypothetical protein
MRDLKRLNLDDKVLVPFGRMTLFFLTSDLASVRLDVRDSTCEQFVDGVLLNRLGLPASSLDLIHNKSAALSLVTKSSLIHQQGEKKPTLVSAYGSDDECEKTKPSPHQFLVRTRPDTFRHSNCSFLLALGCSTFAPVA